MLCIRHHYGTISLNAVQALIYGPMVCIRHHNTAQSWLNNNYYGYRCDPWPIWLNAAWLSTLNLPHHTLSTSFFATLFAGNTWRRKKKLKKMTKIAFCLVPVCYLDTYLHYRHSCWPEKPSEMTGRWLKAYKSGRWLKAYNSLLC